MSETSTRGGRSQRPNTFTSETTTRGIRVQVESSYLPAQSSPRDSQYLFAYHVRIANVGTETAQLVSREWIITSADGEVERVKGPGVVGETPVLAPGGGFEYTSYCPLKTTVGSMQGSYQMVTADGDTLIALDRERSNSSACTASWAAGFSSGSRALRADNRIMDNARCAEVLRLLADGAVLIARVSARLHGELARSVTKRAAIAPG